MVRMIFFFGGVGGNCIIVGVQEIEGAREGVAILMKDQWHSAVVGFGCVSSWILWAKFKFSRVKVGSVWCR